ncbi:TPA: hypothetical protein I9761_003031 [Serratia marcescens]|nr:hypothetical protein [Serratia marcescens]HAT5020338.1 hypothetical protein [Serratia marcescens]
MKKIWLYGILFYSFSVYSVPYELKVHSSNEYPDYLSIESWDVNDTTPNPMRLTPGPDHLRVIYYSLRGAYSPPGVFFVPGARKAQTMGELGKLFISSGLIGSQINGNRKASAAPIMRSCWQLGYDYPNMGGGTVTTPLQSTCSYGDYPSTTCWIDKPAIEIDHGMLTTEVVNGNTAYTDFYVSCSSEMGVNVMSSTGENSVVLSLADGLRSDITINDKKLGDGIAIRASTSPTRLRLSSTLSGYNLQGTGTFSGSFTLVIAPI